MNGTIHVRGLRELQAALKQANGRLDPELKEALKEVAEPVRAAAQAQGARYAGLGPYRVKVRSRGVAVEQSKGRVTGQRGDFGALQVNTLLIPALDSHESEIVAGLERAIDGVAARAGL